MRRRRALLPGAAMLALLALVPAIAAAAPGAATAPRPAVPPEAAKGLPEDPTGGLEHVLMIMQENHTFDNYYGTFPGADGPPSGTCVPRDPDDPELGCVEPFHLESARTEDLHHGRSVSIRAYNEGRMDGFVIAQDERNLPGEVALGYYDGRDLPFYWNLATDYVLADRFFSSDAGGSLANHMYWVAARGATSVPEDGFSFPTIFDRLQEAGIDWKFYVQNYDPSITFRDLDPDSPKASQIVWVPLLNFPRFLDDPERNSRIVDISEYYRDLAEGTLPAVGFIAPSGASEHPPGDVTIGQVYATSLITALMRSSSWSSSLFVVTYDDWGGWYDHVPPPQVDADGYGFRVPALFVSPYSRSGLIDSTVYDYTSVLRFIEEHWGLDPLTARDATANSIGAALDLTQPPKAPRFPASVYPPVPKEDPTGRLALLLIYAGVVLAFVGLIALVRYRHAETGLRKPAQGGLRP